MAEAEKMALAVLKGDVAAACALADALREEHGEGRVALPPVSRISVERDRLRVVVFLKDQVTAGATAEELRHLRGEMDYLVNAWLTAGRPLLVPGIERIELYELPERAVTSNPAEAFAALAVAAQGRWDGVDADEYVRQVRSDEDNP